MIDLRTIDGKHEPTRKKEQKRWMLLDASTQRHIGASALPVPSSSMDHRTVISMETEYQRSRCYSYHGDPMSTAR